MGDMQHTAYVMSCNKYGRQLAGSTVDPDLGSHTVAIQSDRTECKVYRTEIQKSERYRHQQGHQRMKGTGTMQQLRTVRLGLDYEGQK